MSGFFDAFLIANVASDNAKILAELVVATPAIRELVPPREPGTTGKLIMIARQALREPRLLLDLARVDNGRLLLSSPSRWTVLASKLASPLCCSEWSAARKVSAMRSHYRWVRRIGGPLGFGHDEVRDLMPLPEIGPDYALKLDQPHWMLQDGLMTLSLWKGIDRLFSISFVLGGERGELAAYVGGLQGRREDGIVDLYRDLTKDAKGLRPRDLLLELFRSFCRAVGVTQIHAVAEHSRYHWHQDYFGSVSPAWMPSLNYDEVWAERGGVRTNGPFWRLALTMPRKSEEEIASKKRALYRRRWEMLDSIEARMAAIFPGR